MSTQGVAELSAWADELAAFGERMPGIAADALNNAAHALRETDLPNQMATLTGLRLRAVLFRLRVAPADRRTLQSRVIASSQAVPARLYRHGFEMVDAPHNRARVKVAWLGGTKIAPGFINPKGSKHGRPSPLRTRGKDVPRPKPGVRSAHGPSMAALLKAMMGAQLEATMLARLDSEMRRRIEAALA